VVAIIAGLAVGLKRRRRPVAAGPAPYAPAGDSGDPPVAQAAEPPPYDGEDGEDAEEKDSRPAADEPPPRSAPPGDVKVAGAPLTPGERTRPSSWETVPNPTPNPTQEPAPEPETTNGDGSGRTWTVRESESEPTNGDAPAAEESGNGRGPVEPLDRESEETGRDESRGDGAAHS
jgi:hypothetical protein